MRLIVRSGVTSALTTLVLLGTFLSPDPVHGQSIVNVPADYPTIQAAINAAVDGDTVLVAPGTYFENINFMGKAVSVESSSGPEATLLDGGGIRPVVSFTMGETTTALLRGFTIQHGVPDGNQRNTGGGVDLPPIFGPLIMRVRPGLDVSAGVL